MRRYGRFNLIINRQNKGDTIKNFTFTPFALHIENFNECFSISIVICSISFWFQYNKLC